ncbi:hypothetical protein J3F83DRAFT_773336 [Trichoderma novae-zelandiae]
MDDDIETFNLTPSEIQDTTDSLGLSLEGNDVALFEGMALLAEATAASTSTLDPTQGNPPSVEEDEVTSEDPRTIVDQEIPADSDSEAETWSRFSHLEADVGIAVENLRGKARARKQELKALKRRHCDKIRELQEKISRLRIRAPKPRQTGVTWPSLFGAEGMDWQEIYKAACMEGNASPLVSKIHPDLCLRGSTEQELQDDLLGTGKGSLETMSQTFDIPAAIQFQILKHFLHFKGKVVHAISRLDPKYAEDSAPLNRDERPGFHHRLHVGRKPVSIKFAPDPNVFLAPLLVCKRWHFWGSHIFYGENTARNKYTSRRTYPLVWLPEAIRLKTLGIYLPESSKDYMRRRHEPNRMVDHMERKTQLHPNFRGFRQLRTLQGLDYVSCLRGLDRAEFWDFDRWLDTLQRKCPVRDWHFVQDVNNAVRRPKEAGDRRRSQLKNLFPLLPSFIPSEEDWAILLNGLENHDAQGGGSGTSEEAIMVDDSGSSSESSSEGDSDAGSDSDSESNSGSDPGSDDGNDDGNDDDGDDAVTSSRTSSMIPRLDNLHLRDNDDSQLDSQLSAMEVDADVGDDLALGNGQEVDDDQEMDDGQEMGDGQVMDDGLEMDDGPETINDQAMDNNQAMDNDQQMDNDQAMHDDQQMDNDQDTDDESTVVPDNRSVAGDQVVDLTMDDTEQQPEQGPVSPSAVSTSDSRLESPLFVDDYRPSYSPSLMSHDRDDRDDRATVTEWENRSRTSGGHGDEESLFLGSEPAYLRQAPSLAGTRIWSSPTTSSESREVKQEIIDLTLAQDDPTDSFLPAENLDGTPPASRKRELVKVEGGDGGDGGDGSMSAKRIRTREPFLNESTR